MGGQTTRLAMSAFRILTQPHHPFDGTGDCEDLQRGWLSTCPCQTRGTSIIRRRGGAASINTLLGHSTIQLSHATYQGSSVHCDQLHDERERVRDHAVVEGQCDKTKRHTMISTLMILMLQRFDDAKFVEQLMIWEFDIAEYDTGNLHDLLKTTLPAMKTSGPMCRYLCMQVSGVHTLRGQLLQDHFFEFKRAGSRTYHVEGFNYRTSANEYRRFPQRQRKMQRNRQQVNERENGKYYNAKDKGKGYEEPYGGGLAKGRNPPKWYNCGKIGHHARDYWQSPAQRDQGVWEDDEEYGYEQDESHDDEWHEWDNDESYEYDWSDGHDDYGGYGGHVLRRSSLLRIRPLATDHRWLRPGQDHQQRQRRRVFQPRPWAQHAPFALPLTISRTQHRRVVHPAKR